MNNDKNNQLNQQVLEITKSYQENPQNIIDLIKFSAKFHKYSLSNQLLIHSQNRHATFVASFRDWKNKFNYSVKKAEKGIAVRVPVTIKTFIKDGISVKLSEANSTDRLDIANGHIPIISKTLYNLGVVLDISQTDCPVSDYPLFFDMGYQSLTHNNMFPVIQQFCEKTGFTIQSRNLSSISLKGYFNPQDNLIVLNDKLQDTQKLSTLLHEFAHGLLHNTSDLSRNKSEIEFEAEALNIMLHIKLNLDVPESSGRYINTHYQNINFSNDNLNKIFTKLNNAFSFCDNEITKIFAENQLLQQPEKQHDKDIKQANNHISNFLQNV